ncbi:MAG: ABC transporter substrate-binding protein [Armatimonadetes bacterium]|nr:ABC transporter substrate-binding protein [Armatimonadota bacterium]
MTFSIRKRILLFLCVLISALLSAGCASLRGRGASAVEIGPGGKVVLDFWNGFTGPDGKMMEAMVRQFEKEHPDVDIRMQIIPWGTYYDKLTLSLAYGGAPEVFILHAARLPEYASFGVLEPLGDLVASSQPPLPVDDFAPIPWQATFYKGKQYALPLDVHPIGLYYNTKLFKEAGIVDEQGRAKPPTNWEEFLSAAQKLTKDTNGDGQPDQWGFVFTWQRTNWFTFAYQFGGGALSPDLQSCIMASTENLAALRRMNDLIYKYKVAPKPEGIDAWLAFRQGKAAMALEGIYMLASLEEQKGLPYAGAPAPQFGPVRAAWAGSHLLSMADGISPEAARAGWKFMRYLSDHSLMWAKGGQVPVRKSALRSPEFAEMPVQAQFAKQLPYVRYEPLSPKANALFPFVDPAVEAVLLDLESPKEATEDACRRIEQVLERP